MYSQRTQVAISSSASTNSVIEKQFCKTEMANCHVLYGFKRLGIFERVALLKYHLLAATPFAKT